MVNKHVDLNRIVWNRYGFKNLLGWLLVYLIAGPFLEALPSAHILMTAFLTVVLFSAVYAVNKDGRLLSVVISLLVVTLVLMWLAKLGWLKASETIFPALLALYLATLVYSFLKHIVAARRVDSNVICAALSTYLILGLLWSALYQCLESLVPGSFAGGLLSSATDPHIKAGYLDYFSFVTLSTLGYGDITPQTQAATALCQAEAILGQFFSVVLVARLVGIHVAQEYTHDK